MKIGCAVKARLKFYSVMNKWSRGNAAVSCGVILQRRVFPLRGIEILHCVMEFDEWPVVAALEPNATQQVILCVPYMQPIEFDQLENNISPGAVQKARFCAG